MAIYTVCGEKNVYLCPDKEKGKITAKEGKPHYVFKVPKPWKEGTQGTEESDKCTLL